MNPFLHDIPASMIICQKIWRSWVYTWVKVRRLRCMNCGYLCRELPDYIFPYKQYEAEIIRGVLEGFITPETVGYEDYPCEITMFRWKAQKSQLMPQYLQTVMVIQLLNVLRQGRFIQREWK